MAWAGPWGIYYHIPKCGGVSMRTALVVKHLTNGVEVGGRHDPPAPPIPPGAFTVVRYPPDWLRSWYTYCTAHDWDWPECPAEVMRLFDGLHDLDWEDFVDTIATARPGIVGQVFDLYALPEVRVMRLEDCHIPTLHMTPNLPALTTDLRSMIETAEADTIFRYYGVNSEA